VFRSHGEFPLREIYNLAPEGSEVYDSLAWYDRLRYRLMPYIYTVAADTYHRDRTIMRGLPMDFPADAKVRGINDEYLFGPSFLVAPVHVYGARTRPVYLPADSRWYDFYSGRAFEGGREIAAEAPLSRMPLFVKAGSIIPVGPAIEFVGEKPDAPITFYVYTGRDAAFELYEDDGLSNGYTRGAWSRIPVRWDEAAGTLTIGGRTGAGWPGMPAKRKIRVRFISGSIAAANDLDAFDTSVDYAGAEVVIKR
jgi:alpha-D-xyloside xylohydrolase